MALKDFHTKRIVYVWHIPSGYTFRNQGGRIRVEDSEGNFVESITSTELQRGDKLTEKLLRRIANIWVKDNLEGNE
jgi:hypothetical protein